MSKYIIAIMIVLMPLSAYAASAPSSVSCPDRNFAVIKCHAYDQDTAIGVLFDKCYKRGVRRFDDTAKASGLKNATVGNVLFDSLYNNFLITVCYDN